MNAFFYFTDDHSSILHRIQNGAPVDYDTEMQIFYSHGEARGWADLLNLVEDPKP